MDDGEKVAISASDVGVVDLTPPPDPATITTRKDAEAYVRLVGRTCRGPKSEKHAAEIAQLLADGQKDEAAALDDRTRRHPKTGAYGCGQDFNDVIVAGPFDGQMHDYTCPSCGAKGRYGAPAFPALPEGEAAAPAIASA
jgi:hypothetical protein